MQAFPIQVDTLPLHGTALQPNPLHVSSLTPNAVHPGALPFGTMPTGLLQPCALQNTLQITALQAGTLQPHGLPTTGIPVVPMPSLAGAPLLPLVPGMKSEAERQAQQDQIWSQLAQMGYKKSDFKLPVNAAEITARQPTSSEPIAINKGIKSMKDDESDNESEVEEAKSKVKQNSDEPWKPQLPPLSGKVAHSAKKVSTDAARLAMYSQYVNALQFQYAAAGYEVPGADGGTEANARGDFGSRSEPGGYGSGGPFHGHDPARQFTGVVTKWMDEEGFGFISCMESRRIYRKDVFLHKAQIGQESDLYRQRTKVDISRGDMIRFTVEIQRGQPRAKDVQIVGHSDRILAPDNVGGKSSDPVGNVSVASAPESSQSEKRRRQDDDDHGRRRDDKANSSSGRREDHSSRRDDRDSNRNGRRDDRDSERK